MVSKATHTACYEIQNLIGFINYDRLLALVFAGGIKQIYNENLLC